MTRAFDRQRLPGRLLGLVLAAVATCTLAAQDLRLPNQNGSVKFAVIGDSGSGDKEQYEVADQMAKYHAAFKFDRVIMLGDNIYGGQKPKDLDKKFDQEQSRLQGKATEQLEKHLQEIQPEISEVVNQVLGRGGAVHPGNVARHPVRVMRKNVSRASPKTIRYHANALKL